MKTVSCTAALLLASTLCNGLPALAQDSDEEPAAAQPAAEETPTLDSLRNRSAISRWNELRRQWFNPRPQDAAPAEIQAEESPAEEPEQTEIFADPENGEAQPFIRPRPRTAERIANQLRRDDPFPNTPGAVTPQIPAPSDYESNVEPRRSKKITEIVPFNDYEPDASLDDPCQYICPRPDGGPCRTYPDGTSAPVCPEEIDLGDSVYEGRSIPASMLTWEASNLFHNPLYFEDPVLERYGHAHNFFLQPFVSVGKFSGQLIGLPYQMAMDPVCERQFALGWYRPGECAPKKCYQVPLDGHAAAVQAGVTPGMFFIIP